MRCAWMIDQVMPCTEGGDQRWLLGVNRTMQPELDCVHVWECCSTQTSKQTAVYLKGREREQTLQGAL